MAAAVGGLSPLLPLEADTRFAPTHPRCRVYPPLSLEGETKGRVMDSPLRGFAPTKGGVGDESPSPSRERDGVRDSFIRFPIR